MVGHRTVKYEKQLTNVLSQEFQRRGFRPQVSGYCNGHPYPSLPTPFETAGLFFYSLHRICVNETGE